MNCRKTTNSPTGFGRTVMNRTVLLLVVALVGLALTGCDPNAFVDHPRPYEPIHHPASSEPSVAPPPSGYNITDLGASEPNPEVAGPSGVDIALGWSQKYAEASEKLLVAHQQIDKLKTEKQQLLIAQAEAQNEIEQLKKELNDANAMLITLQNELKRWKSDVLAYRGEIRRTLAEQTEALTQIIVLLGGEKPKVNAEGATAQATE